MNKRKWLMIALAAVILSVVGYGSVAYFTADEIAHNVITTGNISVELIETGEDDKPFPKEGVTGILPGTQVTKIVTIDNTGANDCWVRMKAEKDIQLAEGAEGTPDLSLILLDIDTEHWTEKDGWYYYAEALTPGKTTEPLFSTVTFDTAMDNLYQNSTATVTVFAQAVQCANNGETVMDAAGWPEAAE